MQIAKDQNNEDVIAEEFIPLNNEDLVKIKENIKNDNDEIKKVKEYEFVQKLILIEKKKSSLKSLKQNLIHLSFEIQDIAAANNMFLKDLKNCNNSEQIKEKKKIFEKTKTIK